MFYYIRMEELVPEDHLLRLIDKHIDLSFVRDKVKHLYSYTGRPSIDPEVLLRMLLLGYLYGITSERRLCEDVKMHIGYRWFVGLSLEDAVPDHSTFSKNRHHRFGESDLFQQIFDEIVARCVAHGFVTGDHLTVDSTYIKANASLKSLEPVVVACKPKDYIRKLEQETLVEDKPWDPNQDAPLRGQKFSNSSHRSTTDPDAKIARQKGHGSAHLSHAATYVMDNKHRIIVGADAGSPDTHTDCNLALKEIRRLKWRYRLRPKTLGADKGYGAAEFIRSLLSEKIQPHIPVVEQLRHKAQGMYGRERFTYDSERDLYLCPEGNELKYHGVHTANRQHVYRAQAKACRVCHEKSVCTKDRARSISFHIYEDSIARAKELSKTRGYYLSQRKRKQIEELFGEAKEFMGLRRARYRGLRFVREQILMTAAAQNIKRMIKLLSRGRPKAPALLVGPMQMGSNNEGLSAIAIHILRFLVEILRADGYFPLKRSFSTA